MLFMLAATIIFERRNRSLQGVISLMSLFWASLFAAARYQTGDDWHGYEIYYEAINTSLGLLDAYLGDPLMLQFEPGYYFISYGIKLTNAPYVVVNFISVFALFFSVIYFLKKSSLPPYFVVLIFLGLPLISLFYNQVRQAIAIAFILLAIQTKNNKSFVLFCCFAFIFQFSTIIFGLLVFLARFYESFSLKFFRSVLFLMPVTAFIISLGLVEPYELLKLLLPESLEFKIDIYKEEETSLGMLRLVSVGYLIFFANYIYIKLKNLVLLTCLERRVVVCTLLGALLVPYSLILFPNSYAFYGRAVVFVLIVSSFSGAILHKRVLKQRRSMISLGPIYGLGVLSVFYYFVTLFTYSNIYLPYRSIFQS